MAKLADKSKASKDEKPVEKTVADNRRARHEYHLMETFEAGLVLFGTEVKAIRQGRANLADAFARIEDGELWLYNCHISPYDHGNRFNHEPLRKRKLLMHSRQILKVKQQMAEKGLTLIPLKLVFRGNLCKVDLALAKGKHLYDKRETTAARDSKRDLERLMKRDR